MANTENCCVSGFMGDDCHSDKYRANKSMHKINSLLKEEVQLLYLRIAGLKEIEGKSICDNHYKKCNSFYSSAGYKYCDPWNGHAKIISVNLKIIDLKFSEKVKRICNINIITDKKFVQIVILSS